MLTGEQEALRAHLFAFYELFWGFTVDGTHREGGTLRGLLLPDVGNLADLGVIVQILNLQPNQI